MRTPVTSIIGVVGAAILLSAVSGCSSAIEVTSIAPSAPIVIDGKADDWAGHLLYYRDAKLTVGVSNDKEFLYLCVMSSDQTVYRSILMRGLTVWFDTTAGSGKYFGIRYPLEMAESEMKMNPDELPGSHDELMKRRADDATKLALLGAKKESRTEFLLPARHGLDARIGYRPGVFVYEMKVPLGIDLVDGMKLAFSGNHQLSVRFETPEMETHFPTMREQAKEGMNEGGANDGGMSGEGDTGRGGRRGGGAGRREGGVGGRDESHKMQSIDLFMKVQQAK
jgi:hypothetical protein